jgi:hypothetical protein
VPAGLVETRKRHLKFCPLTSVIVLFEVDEELEGKSLWLALTLAIESCDWIVGVEDAASIVVVDCTQQGWFLEDSPLPGIRQPKLQSGYAAARLAACAGATVARRQMAKTAINLRIDMIKSPLLWPGSNSSSQAGRRGELAAVCHLSAGCQMAGDKRIGTITA